MSTTYTYHTLVNGHFKMLQQVEVNLFSILHKLGIKAVPPNIDYGMVVTTSGSWFTYQDGVTITTAAGTSVGTSVNYNLKKKEPRTRGKGFSREEKRNWRAQSKKHTKQFGRQKR